MKNSIRYTARKTSVVIIQVLAIVLLIATIAGISYVGIKAVHEVEKKGLKAIVMKIWEGSEGAGNEE